ncbi:MAG TPA: condensation domain-containing protein, partial [Ignavibacteria bacterium]|nr:condensation domain-containing protein [Ignavibacteria bacterium]
NIVTSEENVNIEFSKEDTGLILKDVHKSYNTQINDILLTALILAFNKWNGENKLLLNLEGHGREDIADNSFSTDISRTVGWFTSVFPVLLKINSSKDTGECIKSVKENLRNIPNNGIGFGLLKYMSDDTEIKKSLSDFPEVEVVFNYLGQMNFQFLPTDWKIVEGLKLSQDGENKRFHSIEINAVVTDDKLLLEFNFSNNIYQRKNIEKLADHFKNSMNGIISHCTGEDKNSGFTPSDFSAAGLDQQELDDLLANLN